MDVLVGLFAVVFFMAYVGLLVITALFFLSIGVWAWVVWGWFAMFVIGSVVAGLKN